ncbi:probable tyrosine-protein phosphatase F54C8.4 [Bradysia coprophila]|uniref:probable tyrosine-protein phosphatase F54C8.4 n=1 Tax=Bradysia coprophila TaxID=38358 RepID=UPI00187D7092|nr:probable tyrosine-protein phosphatase F54C8.4 [Bradysia coprophila]
MTTPVHGFNQSIQGIKIEQQLELKTEECKNFDGKITATATIKIEPTNEPKVEKGEETDDDESSYQLKTKYADEMTAGAMNLRSEDVVDNIVVIKRWLNCVPFKAVVEGTPFVPFKMPFSGSAVQPCPSEKRFRIVDLMKAFPNIGLIIDLSNYRRTYRVSDLMPFGVQYVNIPVQFERQNSLPTVQQVDQFDRTCSTYSKMHPGKLIGVHDQLGNRATAYMICKVQERAGLTTQLAMKRFQVARGSVIYVSMAGVMNGSREAWIPKNEFKPDMKRVGANSNERTPKNRKSNKRRKADKRKANKRKAQLTAKC